MRKWVIAGLVWLATASCATAGRFDAVVVSNILSAREDADMVPLYPVRHSTNVLEPYFPKLIALIEKKGIKVSFIPDVADALRGEGVQDVPAGIMLWGYNTFKGQIYINESLSVDEKFATLVHEYGHSLQPKELDGMAGSQVFVETLSIIVCHKLGKDMTTSSFPYIFGFTNRHEVMLRYATQLDALSQRLVKELR